MLHNFAQIPARQHIWTWIESRVLNILFQYILFVMLTK